MSRALDPYHRIRATVAALFLLAVATLAVATIHGPHHRGVGGALVTTPSATAAPAIGGLVSGSGAAPAATGHHAKVRVSSRIRPAG